MENLINQCSDIVNVSHCTDRKGGKLQGPKVFTDCQCTHCVRKPQKKPAEENFGQLQWDREQGLGCPTFKMCHITQRDDNWESQQQRWRATVVGKTSEGGNEQNRFSLRPTNAGSVYLRTINPFLSYYSGGALDQPPIYQPLAIYFILNLRFVSPHTQTHTHLPSMWRT